MCGYMDSVKEDMQKETGFIWLGIGTIGALL